MVDSGSGLKALLALSGSEPVGGMLTGKRLTTEPVKAMDQWQPTVWLQPQLTTAPSLAAGKGGCWWHWPAARATEAARLNASGFASIAAQIAGRTVPLVAEAEACGRADFTFVTQASPERLWMLEHICQRWRGAIVVAVHTVGGHFERAAGCAQGQVDYVARPVLRQTFLDHSTYPVNALRNAAIARVETSHFLHADVDLWPDRDLLPRLRRLSASGRHSTTFSNPVHAIVVAAFSREVKSECSASSAKADSLEVNRIRACHREGDDMPETFDALKRCILAKECHIFDRYNQDGHGTTDYRTWLRGFEGGKSLRAIRCFFSNRYEPYVVLHKTPWLPRYEERFHGYGKNKIQHVVHLRYAGWSFSVLGRSFLTHFPHHKSAARVKWEGETVSKTEHRAKMDALYQDFLKTLLRTYGSPGNNRNCTKICGT